MFEIGGFVFFVIAWIFFNKFDDAVSDIKVIRRELEELRRDMDDYIKHTESLIEETHLNVWDLNEVRYKRERQENPSIFDDDF